MIYIYMHLNVQAGHHVFTCVQENWVYIIYFGFDVLFCAKENQFSLEC